MPLEALWALHVLGDDAAGIWATHERANKEGTDKAANEANVDTGSEKGGAGDGQPPPLSGSGGERRGSDGGGGGGGDALEGRVELIVARVPSRRSGESEKHWGGGEGARVRNRLLDAARGRVISWMSPPPLSGPASRHGRAVHEVRDNTTSAPVRREHGLEQIRWVQTVRSLAARTHRCDPRLALSSCSALAPHLFMPPPQPITVPP